MASVRFDGRWLVIIQIVALAMIVQVGLLAGFWWQDGMAVTFLPFVWLLFAIAVAILHVLLWGLAWLVRPIDRFRSLISFSFVMMFGAFLLLDTARINQPRHLLESLVIKPVPNSVTDLRCNGYSTFLKTEYVFRFSIDPKEFHSLLLSDDFEKVPNQGSLADEVHQLGGELDFAPAHVYFADVAPRNPASIYTKTIIANEAKDWVVFIWVNSD